MANAHEQLNPAGADINQLYYQGDEYVGTQRLPGVGQKVCTRDGSEFIFVRVPSSDISVGAPVCIPLSETNAFNIKFGVVSSVTAGTKEIQLDTTALVLSGGAGVVPAGFFAGGKLVLPTGSGVGTYNIVSNTAGTASAGITVTLDRGLSGAVADTEDAFVTQYSFYNATGYSATENVIPIGFAVRAFTASTNSRVEYAWVQTKGIGGVKIKTNTGISAGSLLTLGDSAGLVVVSAATDQLLAKSLVATAEITNADVVPAEILIDG